MISLADIFFYGLGALLLILAGLTVLSKNLFRSVLAFLGVILCTAVLFISLRAEMVALAQLMVYVGGILIFVLYAVFLTSELGGRMPGPNQRRTLIAVTSAIFSLAVLLGLAWQFYGPSGAEQVVEPNIASLKSLGLRLLNPGPDGFLIPFELISVLLLAAMVGAIAIAKQNTKSGAKS